MQPPRASPYVCVRLFLILSPPGLPFCPRHQIQERRVQCGQNEKEEKKGKVRIRRETMTMGTRMSGRLNVKNTTLYSTECTRREFSFRNFGMRHQVEERRVGDGIRVSHSGFRRTFQRLSGSFLESFSLLSLSPSSPCTCCTYHVHT